MNGVFISFDQTNYDYAKNELQEKADHVSTVVAAYNAMNLEPLKPVELLRLFTNPAELVFDKMTGGQPVSIAGIEVNKEKALEILVKPVGYTELIELIGTTNNQIRVSLNQFDLVNGKVVVSKEADEKLRRNFESYAKSDLAKKMLLFATSILQKAKELGIDGLLKANPNGPADYIRSLIDGGDGKEVKINTSAILKYNQEGYWRP